MVHLLPLPGAPRFDGSMDQVIESAVADARTLHVGRIPRAPGRELWRCAVPRGPRRPGNRGRDGTGHRWRSGATTSCQSGSTCCATTPSPRSAIAAATERRVHSGQCAHRSHVHRSGRHLAGEAARAAPETVRPGAPSRDLGRRHGEARHSPAWADEPTRLQATPSRGASPTQSSSRDRAPARSPTWPRLPRSPMPCPREPGSSSARVPHPATSGDSLELADTVIVGSALKADNDPRNAVDPERGIGLLRGCGRPRADLTSRLGPATYAKGLVPSTHTPGPERGRLRT